MKSTIYIFCLLFYSSPVLGQIQARELLDPETQHLSVSSDDVSARRAPGPEGRDPRPISPSTRGWTPPHVCYACVDCPTVNANTTVISCPYQSASCVVYAELYKYQKNPTYVRGCTLDRGTCEDLERVHGRHEGITLLHCAECIGDRCNGVARTIPDMIAAILFVVIAPVAAKYTLS